VNGERVKRIVVKTGSQLLCREDGELDIPVLASLAMQMARLQKDGWQVLLVSSGAVAAGKGEVAADKLRSGDPVTRKQVLAATGQVRLMQTYQQLFAEHDMKIAQVLASKSDFQTRNHYLNMRNCIDGILHAGIVPVVNENDVVSITELMFTDNDELAGLLAGMVKAELLCMLSTVRGVFGADDEVIGQWDDSRHRIDDIVSAGTSSLGRGGMHSKLAVARKTAALGTQVIIADGRAKDVLLGITDGQDIGTRFAASGESSPAKRWLASADDHAVGAVRVNEGAEQALMDRNRLASLLLVGVDALEGNFKRGDVIRIINNSGTVLGCGRADYDYEDAQGLLGEKDRKPLIHYDYLYITS